MFYNYIHSKSTLEFALEGALRFFSFFFFLFGGGGVGDDVDLEGNKLG